MIATRLTVVVVVFFLHSVLLLGNCESSQKGQKKMGAENFYMIKGSTFVRSLQTNMFKR